jgi:hypothetical protein
MDMAQHRGREDRYERETMSMERRHADRKEIDLRARVFKEGEGGQLMFESWARTRNLSLNGVYIDSTAIPRVGTHLRVELFFEGSKETLVAAGEVAFVTDFSQGSHPAGFGFRFSAMNPQNRERLMRYFILRPLQRCYERMVEEFPHVGKRLTLRDAALVVNYWENNKEALIREEA